MKKYVPLVGLPLVLIIAMSYLSTAPSRRSEERIGWVCSGFCAHYYLKKTDDKDSTLLILHQPPYHAIGNGTTPVEAYNAASQVCGDQFGAMSMLARPYETTQRPAEMAVPINLVEACLKMD